ncbi:6334_t:CDS:1 [Paraglomus occultum]|uniref:6334_t:CDS:1 n=1 Tax=Paraglomus occultum TaxID=144539 RepID=A0A9N9A358_9GLOM|nr:6334_t:CDS:1 [Paraglomus occultum]
MAVSTDLSLFAVTLLSPILCIANFVARKAREAAAKPWRPEDKVILITGASSGIGESLAYTFSHAGSSVILAARRKDELDRVAERCTELGAKDVLVVTTDVTSEADVENLIKKTEERYGKLDCLVLNAGVSMGQTFDSLQNLDVIKRLMDVNYMGCVNVTFHALPLLKRAPKSRIVVNSSLAGIAGGPYRTGYSASKFAVRGFYEALRADLWDQDIHITIIYPGAVVTSINKTRLGDRPFDLNMRGAMTSEECARIMFEATCNGTKEVVLTGKGKLIRLLEASFPELAALLIHKVSRKMLKG